MPRRRINLFALPAWLQYLIAAVVTAIIAGAGWYVGRDDPVPVWIKKYLIPGLGWLGLLLIVLAAVDRVRRGR